MTFALFGALSVRERQQSNPVSVEIVMTEHHPQVLTGKWWILSDRDWKKTMIVSTFFFFFLTRNEGKVQSLKN